MHIVMAARSLARQLAVQGNGRRASLISTRARADQHHLSTTEVALPAAKTPAAKPVTVQGCTISLQRLLCGSPTSGHTEALSAPSHGTLWAHSLKTPRRKLCSLALRIWTLQPQHDYVIRQEDGEGGSDCNAQTIPEGTVTCTCPTVYH